MKTNHWLRAASLTAALALASAMLTAYVEQVCAEQGVPCVLSEQTHLLQAATV